MKPVANNSPAEQFRFCVVIPMYNEEGNVGVMVREVNKALNENGYRADIILVDDGSKDNTATEAAAASRENPNVIVRTHEVNSGFGSALRTAMASPWRGDMNLPSSWTLISPCIRDIFGVFMKKCSKVMTLSSAPVILRGEG